MDMNPLWTAINNRNYTAINGKVNEDMKKRYNEAMSRFTDIFGEQLTIEIIKDFYAKCNEYVKT